MIDQGYQNFKDVFISESPVDISEDKIRQLYAFMIEMKKDLVSSLTMCVFPFIPGDFAKIVAATLIGKALRVALTKANLLPENK